MLVWSSADTLRGKIRHAREKRTGDTYLSANLVYSWCKGDSIIDQRIKLENRDLIIVPHERVRPTGTGSVRCGLKLPLSADKSDDVFRLSGRHPQSDLYHKHHRVAEQCDPACHQERQDVPDVQVSKKRSVVGNPARVTEMGNTALLPSLVTALTVTSEERHLHRISNRLIILKTSCCIYFPSSTSA